MWSLHRKSTQAIAPTPLQRYINFRNKYAFIEKKQMKVIIYGSSDKLVDGVTH
jgi:hypothetical protein